MHQLLRTQLASCPRRPQLGTKRRLHTFKELVGKQLVARHSVQCRQGPIQRFLQAGDEHGRVISRCHPGRLEPPQSLLAVGRRVELRCKGFLRGGPVHLPRAPTGRIQGRLRPAPVEGLQGSQLTAADCGSDTIKGFCDALSALLQWSESSDSSAASGDMDAQVVLTADDDVNTWLDPSVLNPQQAQAFLTRIASEAKLAPLSMHPVTQRMNSTKYDEPDCIAPLTELVDSKKSIKARGSSNLMIKFLKRSEEIQVTQPARKKQARDDACISVEKHEEKEQDQIKTEPR
ncbi:hypothetical protein CLF_106643 [Clonorchis sinensis]|uniref:Uncharacterized protein n=1 Tax=Clonorchis sinensis TaxID=79923 RepID=G7YFG2_CLOSI|nr:hypothetical protein CLF_106643 [Clonorchis sinensis]